MSKSKGAAKAAPAKKAARVEAVAAVEEVKDWPPGLADTKAAVLFDLIEGGDTVRRAAPKVQLTGQQVYAWKRKYKAFAERLLIAVEIGYEMMLDDIVEDSKSAKDRDTAAAVKERRESLMEHLRGKEPARFKTSPFKAPNGDGDVTAIVGVVYVPMRSDNAGHVPQRQAIDSTATPIKRLPLDSTPAPAFRVNADE